MSRWKEPRAKSSPYITVIGYATLEQELKDIWQRRAEVTKALTAAAAEGDRSENAEYIYRKKELREIDARIRYLQKRMPDLNVVAEVNDDSKVYFGAEVEVEDEQGSTLAYQIVGADELDTVSNKISIDSPLARALLGKTEDDEVKLQIGPVEKTYIILNVHYNF